MRFSHKFRFTLIALALVVGVTGMRAAINSLSPANVYRKDFIQEYLLARAIREGINPYFPVLQLVEYFNIDPSTAVFEHPTPHPPILGVISLPMAWLSYPQAATTWMVFELLCLIASIVLLIQWWGQRPGFWLVFIVTCAVLGWPQVWEDLAIGQVNLLLLLVFIIAWQLLRREKSVSGGIALGFVLSLKLLGWPILAYLILRRKWLSVIVTVGTIITTNLIAIGVIGWSIIVDYYLHVGQQVMSYYRAHSANWSLMSVAWRMFSGMGSPVQIGYRSQPLVYSPGLASVVGYALPLLLLLLGLWMAMKLRRFDAAYGVLIYVSLLINPILWPHYIVIAALPFVITARDLYHLGFPKTATTALGVALLILSAARAAILAALERATGGVDDAEVAFPLVLITLIPLFTLLGCFYLSYRLSMKVERSSLAMTQGVAKWEGGATGCQGGSE